MRLIIICFFALSLSACTVSNYISQDVQIPCFTKKDTFRANFSLPTPSVNVLISYSITSFLGICGSLAFPPPTYKTNELSDNVTSEAGIIYFNRIFDWKKTALFFDLNSGFGTGNYKNNNNDIMLGETWHGPSLEMASKWYKGYLQANLYFVSKEEGDTKKSIQYGIGTKFNLCFYQYLRRNDLEYSELGSDGPVLFNVQRSTNKFTMPVQDLYFFISKDFANSVNLSLKIGYSIPYTQIQYANRQIIYIDSNSQYRKNDFSEKSDQFQFTQLILNFSIGVKLQ